MSDLIEPPAPKVHSRDLPAWRLLLEMGRSSVGVWSDRAFEQLYPRSRVFGLDTLLVNDPEGVRHVLTAPKGRYSRPVAFARLIRPLSGTGLLLAEGDAWRRQRRHLAPLFTPANLGALLPHFILASEAMAERLHASPRANLARTFHEAALDAVLRALFSTSATDGSGRFAGLVRAYVQGPGRPSMFDGFAQREDDFAFASGSRRRFAARRESALKALIAARRQASQLSGPSNLLDLLLDTRDSETAEPLSDTEIADQAATFLFAGFETTSRLLFWASYLLALDQGEQVRLQQEVDSFPPERVQSLDDLRQWPALRRTLLEALRLYPPAPNLPRLVMEDDVIGDERVKRGTQVWISPWVLHRHRRFWDHPTAFMPGRFKDEPSPWTGTGAFIPFGGGPRICIGAGFAMAEAQIMLARLVHCFAFSLENNRPILPKASITIAPHVEPWFRIEPRR
jgi:cytochrome P450